MDGSKSRDVFRLPGFLAFWSAETVSEFGTYITTLALQVMVVVTLQGGATDVGLLNASRWLPYLALGLIIGALVDRWRRKPLLVGTDLGRALLLGAIPALWWLGWLSLPLLMVFVALFGVLTLLNDAASQSFVPRLVPAPFLLAANARLDQGASAAQTSGPAVAGALISAVSAPLAVLVDAASYLVSALVVWRIPVEEPRRAAAGLRPHLRREIGEGLAFVYRHRVLSPFAVGTHGWFLFNSMLTTVFVPFVLLELKLTPFEMGLALAAAGVTGLVGSLLATRIGRAWGAGGAVIACRALMPGAWAVIALAPAAGGAWTLAALAVGQGLYGLAMGASNANEMGYRQAVTPDALQARMNTTMRSLNRAMIVIGAPLGGWLADTLGYRPTFWIAIAGFVAVTLFLAASPFRHARHGDPA
ncbi:MFS transporter [Phenylobacterium sp.]|uniref:MFS transporter n=1 Tax=Phenylobacterium sp. TaxID=1871053 RepID=UPI002737C714|nr:MFS transporter [Phenylobacterium sp.]MDP3870513.1 MFS transporter [Phenylobacterium sp.]